MVGAKKLVLIPALSLLLALPAAAQTVRGLLTDSLTSSPIPGAFVTMIDEHGSELARTITNGSGEFVLTATTPGTYRLRSKRIGFRPYVSAPLTLRAGETVSFQAVVHPIPVALASVVVEGDRQCDVAGGASVAAMWDEVREALTAVVWTSRLPNYWYDIGHFQRELSPSGRRKGTDSTWRDVGYRLVPFRSAPPEELEANGFVVPIGENQNEGYTYWAPDAEVLVSNPFLRTHCFETKDGHGETSQLIGLAFTPAKGRDKPDVAGTLWIDRKTAELRLLEFTYKNLPEDLIAPRAGGTVEFLRLPSGTWIVHNWAIRMPLAVMKQRPMGMGTEPEVVGFRETGGAAVEIKTRGGTVVFRSDSLAAALATVTATSAAMASAAIDPAPQLAPATMSPGAPGNGADTGLPAGAVIPAGVGAGAGAGAGAHSPSHNSNLITQADVQSSTATDAYSIVQELRPMWLRNRGTISIHDPSSGNVQVYLNGNQFGEPTSLREIVKQDIREIRFYSGSEAQMKFGAGHEGGVIDVRTGMVAPTGTIASAPPAAPPPPPNPTPIVPAQPDTAAIRAATKRHRTNAYNQNVLDPEEFEGTPTSDVLSLIQRYRPNWLVTRGTISIYDQTAGQVHVAMNGTILTGDVNRLRDYRAMDVKVLRFLSAGDAQQRYGSGHGGGVIEMWMK